MVFRTSSGGPGIATLTPVRASAPTTCRSETQSHKSAAIPGSVVSRSQQTVALVRVACPRGAGTVGPNGGMGGGRPDVRTHIHPYIHTRRVCTRVRTRVRVPDYVQQRGLRRPEALQHKLQAATENQSQFAAVFPRTTMTSCSNNHSIIYIFTK